MNFLLRNKYPILFISVIVVFRFVLQVVELLSVHIPLRPYFAHIIPWFNFDGMHYISIAQGGYVQFQQAFFPLFPRIISSVATVFGTYYELASLIVVYGAFIFALIMFFELANIDYKKKQSMWAVVFLLAFPTAFFMMGVYTEALFLGLICTSFFLVRKKKFFLSSIFAGLASSTRIIGIFLAPALLWELYQHEKKISAKFILKAVGLLSVSLSGFFMYCWYLWKEYGDPVMFMTSQPAFGAGRSGGEIILLPQVLWRYLKIFMTVPYSTFDFWIALLEIVIFALVALILVFAYIKRVRFSYIIFSALALIFPTLSGTMSSIPRYALVCIAIYFALSEIKRKHIKYLILIFSILLEVVLASLFLRGYFVS